KVLKKPEVEDNDGANEGLQYQQELTLGNQVRLARLINQLRDLEHRFVDWHVLELRVDHQAKKQAKSDDDQSVLQERSAINAAQECRLGQIWQNQIRFSTGVLGGLPSQTHARVHQEQRGGEEQAKEGIDAASDTSTAGW